jgi:hypothetical protein
VIEGTDASDVGAIVRGDGRTLLVHTDINGLVQLDIIERRTQTPIYSTTFSAGSSGPLYDTPQVDAYWGLDLIGYNFRYLPTVAQLLAQGAAWKGGRTYDHVYRFPTTLYGTVRAIFRRTIIAGAI